MSSTTLRPGPLARAAICALLLGAAAVLAGRAHAFATAPLPDFNAGDLVISHVANAFSAVGRLNTFTPVGGAPVEFFFEDGGFDLQATIADNNDPSPTGSLLLRNDIGLGTETTLLTGDLVAFEIDASTVANPDGATLEFLFTNLGGTKAADYGGAGGQAVAILTNTGFQLGSADFNTGFSNTGIGISGADVVPGVPEPGTLALFAGTLGLLAWRQRRFGVAQSGR